MKLQVKWAPSMALLLALLVTGCGDETSDDANDVGPVAAPVTGSIPLAWTDRSAFGGEVWFTMRGNNEIIAILESDVGRMTVANGEWQETPARGSQIVELQDGTLLTDSGFKRAAGETGWVDLDFEGHLAVSADGLQVYRLEKGPENLRILASQDAGSSWIPLAEVPASAEASSSLAFSGQGASLVTILNTPSGWSVWRFSLKSLDWEGPLFSESGLSGLATGDTGIVVTGWGKSYWSADGIDWEPILFNGKNLVNALPAGRDEDGNPLLAVGETVFRLDAEGEATVFLAVPGSIRIHHVDVAGDGVMVASANGVWSRSEGAASEDFVQVGIAGDHIRNVVHFDNGKYYASALPSVTNAWWARLDTESGSWIRQALSDQHVMQAVTLHDGSHLLATASAEEYGFGGLARWKKNEDAKQLSVHVSPSVPTPPIVSVTVNAREDYFVAFGDGVESGGVEESSDYEILLSFDQGESWERSTLEPTGQRDLATFCDNTFASGTDGLHVFDTDEREWNPVAELNLPIEMLVSREQGFLAASEDRIWLKRNCTSDWTAVPVPQGTNSITSIDITAAGLWAVTNDGGIHLPDGSDEWFSFDTELPEGEREILGVAPDGEVWVRVVGRGLYSGHLQ